MARPTLDKALSEIEKVIVSPPDLKGSVPVFSPDEIGIKALSWICFWVTNVDAHILSKHESTLRGTCYCCYCSAGSSSCFIFNIYNLM